MRKLFVLGVCLIWVINVCGEYTTPTKVIEPISTMEGRILEITITGNVAPVGELKRGMGFLCVPGEEKTIELKLTYPEIEEAIKFRKTDEVSRHTYESGKKVNLSWTVEGGEILQLLDDKIIWKAPEKPGDYRLRVLVTEERRWGRDEEFMPEKRYVGTFDCTAIVLYPYDATGKGALEGYAIGVYPNENAPNVSATIANHREKYRPPKYFIRVSPINEHIYISKHFRLGDFSSRAERGKTRFIALDYSLVKRLEKIIDILHVSGKKVEGLKILRAYVSPLEREELKRRGIKLTEFSRYLYGDAAAFIVDEDGDNKLDDLNGDGKIDIADAEFLADIAERAEAETRKPGGIGIFGSFQDPYFTDTPYVQVDTRGWLARWRVDEP